MEERLRGKNGHHRSLKIMSDCLFGAMVLVVLWAGFILARSLWTHQTPTVLGYRLYSVESGSMEPTLPVGSLIAIKSVPASSLNPGDIILYQKGNNLPVTHRIDDIAANGDSLTFTTKGDANKVVDPNPVEARHVQGRVTVVIPYAAGIMGFFKTPYGLAGIAAFFLCLLLAEELLRRPNNKNQTE